MKVLVLSSEVMPLVKTGGLADVAGSLPLALKRLGMDIRLVLPLYHTVREGPHKIRPILQGLEVPLGGKRRRADIFEARIDEQVPVYLIQQADLYDRTGLYGDSRGDYVDNLERFSFFCHAALKLVERISFRPDVIHCHDWQAGLVPALIEGPYGERPVFSGTGTLFTIHNLGYQGLFPADGLPKTGLPKEGFFHSEGLEFWGKISLLKAGIVYADLINTVSPAYAEEIQTPEQGMGMDGILQPRRASLHGILNGVDYALWDPSHDSCIRSHYSPGDLTGKGHCKETLIREMGLDPSFAQRPLLGVISRFDVQKGLDLLVKILHDVLDLDAGLVVLGSGDERIQKALQQAAADHPGQIGVATGFDEPLAHRILAGTDLFLIPSRYEPCGLTQMYALRYGTVPLVRATGGLRDTIVPFDQRTGEGNGFSFGPFDPASFLSAIRKAIELFHDRTTWKKLMINGMKEDFSWDFSARRYLELFRSITEK